MKPHDSLIVSLPYPVKIFGLTFAIKRKIGFYFTNLSNFLFAENYGLNNSADFEKWIEKNGQNRLVLDALYFAANAYCYDRKIKENFTRDGLEKAIALADEKTKEQIMEIWRKSETFGATIKKKSQAKVKK
jgi:hypothetical protein